MAEQRENNPPAPAPPAHIVITDRDYLKDPDAAFTRMRSGVDVIVEPTNGCARMALSASLLSDMQLDD